MRQLRLFVLGESVLVIVLGLTWLFASQPLAPAIAYPAASTSQLANPLAAEGAAVEPDGTAAAVATRLPVRGAGRSCV